MRVIDELFKACEDGDLDKLKRLIKQGVDVNSKDEMFETPLMKGCREGHLEIVRELIKNGANVSEQSMFGMSPLMLSCMEIHLEIVKELIKCGANVNRKDIAGVTPLMRAGSVEIVRELIRHGANINEKDNMERTALINAYEDGNPEVMAELINNGIDISDIPDEELESLSKDNSALGISLAIRKMDYKGLSECLGKYYEDLYKEDSDRALNKTDNTKHKSKKANLIKLLKTAKVKILKKSKNGIGKFFKGVSKKTKHIKKEMVKPLDGTEKYLRSTGYALEKIDYAKKYIANIKRSKYMMDQRKIKQELEKDIKAIGDCRDEYELDKIAEAIVKKRDIKLAKTDEEDISISAKDLISILEEQLQTINKVQQQIKNFENRIDLDYKHMVFEGINLSKKNKDKGKEIF